MFFEFLETRRLMSSTFTFLDGTTANLSSTMDLQVKSGKTITNVAVVEDHGYVQVINNNTSELAQFTLVHSIKIMGGQGDDTIVYRGNSMGADIDGNNGRDYITIYDAGDNSSNINAGPGDDNLEVVYSKHAKLKGDAGNDLISINTGAKDGIITDFSGTEITIDGGSGDDTMYLYGGYGRIVGSSGNDSLFDRSGGIAVFSTKKVELIDML
jgi:hypothetical protein